VEAQNRDNTVFGDKMTANIEHLANRSIEPDDVADIVFGVHGRSLVRREGRGARERWLITGPVEIGQLVTCVFRAAAPRDLESVDAFSIPPMATSRVELGTGVKLCVTGWFLLRMRSGSTKHDFGENKMATKKSKGGITKSRQGKKPLPSFRSDSDERAFWDSHDATKYFDDSSVVDIEIRPARTKQIAVRLLESDVEALQKLAKKKGVGYNACTRGD
jgi:hypothetical protein